MQCNIILFFFSEYSVQYQVQFEHNLFIIFILLKIKRYQSEFSEYFSVAYINHEFESTSIEAYHEAISHDRKYWNE